VGDQTCLVACLEEATERLWVRRGEQGGLNCSAFRACGPALGAAEELPHLAVALFPSLSSELTETQVDVAAINGSGGGPD
jgi:hypothetical protein